MLAHGAFDGDRAVNSRSESIAVAISNQELQSLAEEFETPVEFVEQVYEAEAARIRENARIDTFIAVLTVSRVRATLRTHRLKH
jgi:Asp-tRNA(Asn)/Glu-tRNA(Gln) amidotransferase C subunit